VDDDVCELAVALRREHKIKLPNAIVWSTAQVHNLQLVTRNTKDFDRNAPGIRVPYEI
jgi:predicted nucleic acid-binding protein